MTCTSCSTPTILPPLCDRCATSPARLAALRERVERGLADFSGQRVTRETAA
jgi:hypothetical protein